MPGSSWRPLAQHQVRDGAFGLVSPLKRRRVFQAKVTIRQQQRIKKHCHGIGRSALQPLTQVLQVLEEEEETRLGVKHLFIFSHLKWKQMEIFFLPKQQIIVGVRLSPAPAGTGEAALSACCAAGGWGATRQVSSRGCGLTAGRTGRSPMGRYLGDKRRGSRCCRSTA